MNEKKKRGKLWVLVFCSSRGAVEEVAVVFAVKEVCGRKRRNGVRWVLKKKEKKKVLGFVLK